MNVADRLGFRSLPEKMQIATAIEKELAAVLEAAAVDLKSWSADGLVLSDRCVVAAAAKIRAFAKSASTPKDVG